MRTTVLIILTLAGLLACKKDPSLTFDEYYSCEKELKATISQLDSDLKNHNITQSTYDWRLKKAKIHYDSCLILGEGNK